MNTISQSPLINPVATVRWQDGACVILDQARLPREESYVSCRTFAEIVERIRSLSVRGAPAIGVAGAYGAVLAARQALALPEADRASFMENALRSLEEARPTAVNLRWAVGRMRRVWSAQKNGTGVESGTVERLLEESHRILDEEIAANTRMAALGAGLLVPGPVLTYCNTGSLATGGRGTALAVVEEGYRRGLVSHVFACETRPLLQGLRLTAWELARYGIPYTVICDNMAGSLLRREKISAVIVGADRVARNGDTANKIGTYGLAILAKHHGVPFYVTAPVSTFDPHAENGEAIPIEERAAIEIVGALGDIEFSPNVHNPAFDVTPHELITAFICERGVLRPPFSTAIASL